MRKEVWFGLTIMAMVVLAAFILLPSPAQMTNGHLGLLMLALVVVAIMLGFPTAFTLMGMGMVFAWIAYRSQNPDLAVQQTLDLMVQRTYSVMSNDVLISIPLFVFMGYLIERANLIEKLFKSMHLATARVPGSLAVATIITCAIFATATGIVGAVVTLMGLLALPAMLRAGYSVQLSAGAITAGGCLGILIPPSVMLIVYGATAGVSVVKLYAGAFFPGLMLAGLYILYVIILAKLKPHMAPPMSAEDRHVPLPEFAEIVSTSVSNKVLPGLIGAIKGKRNAAVPMTVAAQPPVHCPAAGADRDARSWAASTSRSRRPSRWKRPRRWSPWAAPRLSAQLTKKRRPGRARGRRWLAAASGRGRSTRRAGCRGRGASRTQRASGCRTGGRGAGGCSGSRACCRAGAAARAHDVLDCAWPVARWRWPFFMPSSASPGWKSSRCCWARFSRWPS